MQPFQEARMPKEYYDINVIMESQQCGIDEAHKIATRFRKEKVYLNDRYQVIIAQVDFQGLPMLHLSIKRRDKECVHDWRDLQEIKNMLVGTENEGFELYPAESRLVDEANQYHLWVFANSAQRIPVGDTVRRIGTPEMAAKYGAKQRAF